MLLLFFTGNGRVVQCPKHRRFNEPTSKVVSKRNLSESVSNICPSQECEGPLGWHPIDNTDYVQIVQSNHRLPDVRYPPCTHDVSPIFCRSCLWSNYDQCDNFAWNMNQNCSTWPEDKILFKFKALLCEAKMNSTFLSLEQKWQMSCWLISTINI